jgi:hypothetical protein
MMFATVYGKSIVSAHDLPFAGVDPDQVLSELSSSSTFSLVEASKLGPSHESQKTKLGPSHRSLENKLGPSSGSRENKLGPDSTIHHSLSRIELYLSALYHIDQ